MLSAIARYSIGLFAWISLLGGTVIVFFTQAGPISKVTGYTLATLLLCVGIPLTSVLVREWFLDWKLRSNGQMTQGRIQTVNANRWLNAAVFITYTYQVNEQQFTGNTWTHLAYLDQVPPAGSVCKVIYDNQNPQRSVIDELLKPEKQTNSLPEEKPCASST